MGSLSRVVRGERAGPADLRPGRGSFCELRYGL